MDPQEIHNITDATFVKVCFFVFFRVQDILSNGTINVSNSVYMRVNVIGITALEFKFTFKFVITIELGFGLIIEKVTILYKGNNPL